MPKSVQLAVPPHLTPRLLSYLDQQHGILGVQLQKGASVRPPGDILTVQLLNRDAPAFLRVLKQLGVATDASSSLLTQVPASIVSAPDNDAIVSDSSESTWEEMEMMMARESNMELSALLFMVASGALAAVGILGGTLHLVIGAMLIAPGFEPLSRISLNVANGSREWRRGLVDSVKAYLSLILGALLGVGLVQLWPPEAAGGYMASTELLDFWSSLTPLSLAVSLVAGASGAMLVVTNRSVLTAGVMVALALIPSPVVALVGLLEGNREWLVGGGLRWLVEVALVLLSSALVFFCKRWRTQRRTALW